MEIISKQEAQAKGLKRYYTGIPCVKGHLAERLVGYSSPCTACRKENYTDNRDVVLNNARLRRIEDDSFVTNRSVYMKEYHSRPGVKEKQSAYMRDWNPNNRDKRNEYQLIRSFKESLATPPWANLDAMVEFYKARPDGFHVDHIIPLQGKNVCGLNVRNNLQYLTVRENCSKGNSFNPEEEQFTSVSIQN